MLCRCWQIYFHLNTCVVTLWIIFHVKLRTHLVMSICICRIVNLCLLVGTLNSLPPGFLVPFAESSRHVHFCFHTSMFSVHHSPQQQNCSVSFLNSQLTLTVERLMVLIVLLDSALRFCWVLLEWIVFINHAILPVKTQHVVLLTF